MMFPSMNLVLFPLTASAKTANLLLLIYRPKQSLHPPRAITAQNYTAFLSSTLLLFHSASKDDSVSLDLPVIAAKQKKTDCCCQNYLSKVYIPTAATCLDLKPTALFLQKSIVPALQFEYVFLLNHNRRGFFVCVPLCWARIM